METKRLPIQECELKWDDESWKVAGYASVFNSVDKVGDTILPGAFEKSLKEGERVGMHLEHLRWVTPGMWTHAEENEKGLWVEGQLTRDHSVAKDLRASMRHGTIRGLSIGFIIPPDGAKMKGDNRIIKEIDLREVSFTATPAEPKATIEVFKSELQSLDNLSDFEDFLRESGGFSKSMATALVGHLKSILRSESATEAEEAQRIREVERAEEIKAMLNHYQLGILRRIQK